MLFHPPGCWDAGLKFGSEWELLVESYCYSDPHNADFEIPGPEGKVGNQQISLNHAILAQSLLACIRSQIIMLLSLSYEYPYRSLSYEYPCRASLCSHAALTVICIPLQITVI